MIEDELNQSSGEEDEDEKFEREMSFTGLQKQATDLRQTAKDGTVAKNGLISFYVRAKHTQYSKGAAGDKTHRFSKLADLSIKANIVNNNRTIKIPKIPINAGPKDNTIMENLGEVESDDGSGKEEKIRLQDKVKRERPTTANFDQDE